MSEITRKRLLGGAGLGLGAIVAAPAAAQADDFRVTNLNDSGAGSLREAVEDASVDPDADRILFKSRLSGVIDLGGELGVNDTNLEIVGPGARRVTLAGPTDEPAFDIEGPVSGVTVAISGLAVTGGDTVNSCGGIAAGSDVDLTLSRVVVSRNSAGGDGGGVCIFGPGSLVLENSTISGNSASDGGGGIYSQNADVSVRSSTISGNSANVGGGMEVVNDGDDPEFDVRNSTVIDNVATDIGGGLAGYDLPQAQLRGTIVAGNDDGGSFPDLDDGPWTTSFSLIGDPGGAIFDSQVATLLNVDPKLKPLKNNGGPTDTHAFKKSPAKNKGPSDAPNSDQRGAPRKGKADIGAYELTKCKGVIVNRVGTARKDKLKGTKKADGILGLGGNDKLSGKKGKDGLCGGSGKDKLKGGPGKDKLDGGPGKDKEIQ